MKSYRDLQVWQLGMEIARDVYRITATFPKHEAYALSNQLRRAAVSIPANIAGGHAKDSTRDFLPHLSITLGSAAELETELILAKDLGYAEAPTIDALLTRIDETGRMIRGLQRSLKQRLNAQHPNPPK